MSYFSKIIRKARTLRIVDHRVSPFGAKLWNKLYIPLGLIVLIIICRHAYFLKNNPSSSFDVFIICASLLVLFKLYKANKFINRKVSFLAKLKKQIKTWIINLLPVCIKEPIIKLDKYFSKYKRQLRGAILSIAFLSLFIDVVTWLFTLSAKEFLLDYVSLSPLYTALIFIYLLFFDNLEFSLNLSEIEAEVKLTSDKKSLNLSNGSSNFEANNNDDSINFKGSVQSGKTIEGTIDKDIKIKIDEEA